MKLIATDAGRVTLLLPIEETRPLEGYDLPRAIQAVTERYNFQHAPTLSGNEGQQEFAERFRFGFYNQNGKRFAVRELQFFGDGIVASCATTDAAEIFLNDLFEWGADEFGLRRPTRKIRTLYASTVLVQFDVPAQNIIGDFQNLAEILTYPIKDLYNIDPAIDVFSISFQADPSKVPGYNSFTQFRIERRLAETYDTQFLYCAAPLPTLRHLALLEEVERFAISRSPNK